MIKVVVTGAAGRMGTQIVRLVRATEGMALHGAVRRSPPRAVPALVLLGFGSIRLAVEPWRAPPPLGDGLLPAWTLAALWVCAGLGLALDSSPRAGCSSAID